MTTLGAQGLQPYKVWSLPVWLNTLVFRPLSPAGVVEFCLLISHHVRAGSDLRQALEQASASASNARLRMLCGRMKRVLEKGDSLSQALQQTRAFPHMLSQLVVVGQETGRLGQILAVSATQFEQMRQLRGAIRRSLIYPGMVMLVLLFSSAYWAMFVMPKMVTLFDSLRVEVPSSTRTVIHVTQWLTEHGAWLPLPILLLTALLLVLGRQAAIRPMLHALLWWLPGVRRLERARVYHAFFSHLGAMHGGGLTLNRTLRVLLEQPLNAHFGQRLGRLMHQATRGQSLESSLASSGMFERFALSLVRLGESTGTLDEQSLRLSEHYAQQLKQQVETSSRLFEPVILLVLGVLLLLIGSTMLGPVYDLASRASSGLMQ